MSPIPVCDSLLQLSEQVPVELVELRQVVEDLAQDALLHHRLPVLTGRLGNRIPEVLQGHKGLMLLTGLLLLFSALMCIYAVDCFYW